MAIGVDGKEKPNFIEGQFVTFDLDGKVKGEGFIRGKSVENVIDFWIIEVTKHEGFDKSIYPWSCITVPHTLIKEGSS
jgi:hypothetical protein